jgi:peptidoglycan hydrolase CwlO-like protein
LQILKQEISSIEENLDDLNLQLEQQSKENDKALQDQFKKLQSDLDDSMNRFEKRLDSLSQQY